jgi:hypothetical protein
MHIALERMHVWPSFVNHFESRTVVETTRTFYPSVFDLDKTVSKLRASFPEEERRIITAAEKVLVGRFDLLGYRDLYFNRTVPDWHHDPLSGKDSPRVHWSRINELRSDETGDKKIIWELNRHQFFVVLGQAYRLTGDQKYADCFCTLISDWMDSNPPKVGVNWLSSLEVSFRSISWIWAIYLFEGSPRFTPAMHTRMREFLYLFGRHIETYLSTYFSPNTHLTGEALGLYILGSFLSEAPEADRWKHKGHSVLLGALKFQVRVDGTYCEQSSHYLRYTIDFYCNLLLLRRFEGYDVQPEVESKLNQLFDCLLHITTPDGRSPNFGDDDGGRLHFLDGSSVDDFRPALALGAVVLNRGDLKFAAGTASPELLWLLGPDGPDAFTAIEASEPAERIKSFSDGGIFCARSGWTADADHIVIDCGPHGFMNGGHAHADALGFVLTLNGSPIFIDSGTYNYTSDLSERNRFRSSHAHNCLTVNNQSSSRPAGPFSWKTSASSSLIEWRTTPDGKVVFRGTHDGFETFDVRYERTIEIDFDDRIQIEDFVSSPASNVYELHFVLSPDLRAEITDPSGTLLITNGAGSKVLRIESTAVAESECVPSWRTEAWAVSTLYGERTGTQKLVCKVEGPGEIRVRTRLMKM